MTKTNKNERLLRAYIRKALQIRFNSERDKYLNEVRLRKNIQNLILEVAAEKVEADPHMYTGINVLRELFKNTNILKTLRQKYKTMTTRDEQRESFRAHIITWMVNTLAPISANDSAGKNINERLSVDIDVITDEERGMFLDADDGSDIKSDLAPEEEEEKAEESEFEEIEGKDTTGRNKAEEVYGGIETSIVDYYGSLSDLKDQELFKKWLIANTKLYFDKWEKELQPSVEEPTNQEYEKSKVEDSPAATEEIPTMDPETQEPEEAPEVGNLDDLGDMKE